MHFLSAYLLVSLLWALVIRGLWVYARRPLIWLPIALLAVTFVATGGLVGLVLYAIISYI